MSGVFTGSKEEPQTTPETTTESTTEDWVGQVAGQLGEKFRDPNELAKSVVHSQDHIRNLEAQLAEMREDLGKKDYMKEVLERIDSQQAKPSGGESEPVTTSTDNTGTTPEVSVDQIKTLIAETLTQQEAANTAEANLVQTDTMLTDAFGTDAQTKVEERRQALGMSTERMKQLAEESPTAFMALMGEAPRRETNQQVRTQVNTEGFGTQSDRKDFAYWQKMRKENSKLYYNPKTQREMFAAREKLGEEAFYNR